VRLERGCANAQALAELLAARDDVAAVHYPGLASDPGYEIARAQMRGFGMVVSFDLETPERAERFLVAAQLVWDATSFGSVHTTAERRARWRGDDVSEGFIRLSAGIEETVDLVADVGRALDACSS
jgi:cystathionine gamma-lyase